MQNLRRIIVGVAGLSLALPLLGSFQQSEERQKPVSLTPVAILGQLRSGKMAGAHTDYVAALDFSPDGRFIATGSADGTVKLWSLKKKAPVRQFSDRATGPVQSIGFSGNGKLLAAGGQAGGVVVWKVESGKRLRKLSLPTANKDAPPHIKSVALSQDGKTLLAAVLDHTVYRIAVKSGKKQALIAASPEHPSEYALGRGFAWSGEKPEIYDFDRFWFCPWEKTLALTPDGRLAVCRASSRSIAILDVQTGRIRAELEAGKGTDAALSDNELGSAAGLALSPDGRRLAVVDTRGKARIWELATGKVLLTRKGWYFWTTAFAFSSDARLLAIATDEDKIRIIDCRSGEEVVELEETGKTNLSLAFSPDGKLLAASGLEGVVRLWNVGGIRPKPAPVVSHLEIRKLNGYLDDLGGGDSRQAQIAIENLAANPELSLPFIEEHLFPEDLDKAEVSRWMEALDDENFEVRDQVDTKLRQSGGQAEEVLRERLKKKASPETKARIRKILEALRPPFMTFPSEPLRRYREVEVLERIGRDEARTVLERAEKESPSELVREQARLALERLDRASPEW
ncbi:MAG: WD40 repeat domain-containing protein [Planctomycetota bacterium]|nr:WD40 repeat domain-containing protein [Planctomycetota bacterium]